MILADLQGFTSRKSFRLYLWGDAHVGNAATSYKSIEKAIEMLKADKGAYWVFLGDAVEAIHVGDKRYDPAVHEGKYSTINAQVDDFAELFAPVAKRGLCMIAGNHERSKNVRSVVDVVDLIGRKLAVYNPKLVYRNDKMARLQLLPNLGVFMWHGGGSINSRAVDPDVRARNNAESLMKKLCNKMHDCELNVTGHFHRIMHKAPSRKTYLSGKTGKLKAHHPTMAKTDDGDIPPAYRHYYATGSFLRGMMDDRVTYAEEFGYDPTELGFGIVEVQRGKIDSIETVYVDEL